MTFEIDKSESEEQEDDVPENDVVPLNFGVPFNYVHHIEDKKLITPSPVDETESIGYFHRLEGMVEVRLKK
jgi:hypothetical protein